MMIKISTLLFAIALLSCSNSKSRQASNSSDSINLTLNSSIQKIGQINYQSDNWSMTCSNHKLGILTIGDSIQNAIDLIKQNFIVIYDSSEACEGCTDEFEYYYKVLNNSNQLVFTIHPGYDNDDKFLISRFNLYDSGYKTDKGISIGNTVKELKQKYTIKEAYFDYDKGLFLFVEGFDCSFKLDYNTYSNFKDFDFEHPTPETIPENCVIELIVII